MLFAFALAVIKVYYLLLRSTGNVKSLQRIIVFIWAIPRSLFRSFRAIFRNKNEDFSGILTGIVGVVGEHTDHTAQPKNYQIFSSQSTTIFLKVYLVLSSDIITNQVQQHNCSGQIK